MSRRSARLIASGYYHQSDEDSDSSTLTTVDYRESPVRVFKKRRSRRSKSRSPAERTSSRASSNAASAAVETPVATESPVVVTGGSMDMSDGLSPSLQQTVVTVPYITPTPRPTLIRTSAGRSREPQETSSASARHRLRSAERRQKRAVSSGYSSSGGGDVTPRAAASNATATHSRRSFSRMGSVMAAAVQSRMRYLSALANRSFNNHVWKRFRPFLLLLIIALSAWTLVPFLRSLPSSTNVIKTPPQTQHATVRHPSTWPPPVQDPAFVSAVVEEKMQRLLKWTFVGMNKPTAAWKKELLLKQEADFSQLERRVQQDVRMRLQLAEADGRRRLQDEVAGFSRQIADYQSDFSSVSSSLNQRIQDLEAQNAKLSQELLCLQPPPPPDPCPDPSALPAHSQLSPELQQAMEKFLTDRIMQQDMMKCGDACGRPAADRMADFALETQGASVVSTRCSETYRIRSACMTLFGFPLWYPSESPRTVIQGHPVLLPGKCWAFHSVRGTLVISLSHPIMMTHVTLDHLPHFEVYGMVNETAEGLLLGNFTYDQDGAPTQTFKLLHTGDVVYRFVELHVLSNWGHVEYTCVYRFRVHGKIPT
ncbi:hypothetical protein LDENG_00138560 [Lucifuga dentata]|nr:hypothetical protein LDENG_00138560 [Lucifuga dentata]